MTKRKNNKKYNKTWISWFNKNKTKELYDSVLVECIPEHKRCRCCDGPIYYYDSIFRIDKNYNLYVDKKSYLTNKEIYDIVYYLSICEDCLIKKYPEYENKNKSRVFNMMNEITSYAFDIPLEIRNKWKNENYNRTLDNYINIFGLEIGTEKWNNYCKKQSVTNTFEYKKEKSSRVGNMEVSCVKGSVEVTVNGSDNGPVAVDPGTKMNAQAPVLDEPEADDKLKKVETKIAIVDKKVLVLKDTEGLKPGMKIEGAGLPSDVEIVAVNNETHEVTLNKPVTVEAGVEISIIAPLKKVETKVAIVNQKSVELLDSEGLKPGMKVQGAGLPPDLEVVSVDPETHIVTFNKPITVEAGVKIEPVLDRELLPSIITPVISMGRLDPSEISGIAKSLSSGSSLPSKLTDEIQNIADKKDDYIPPKDNGRKDSIDDVIKGISENIERGTQTNPSPTQ